MNTIFATLCYTLNRDHYDGWTSGPYVDYDGNRHKLAIAHGSSGAIAFIWDGTTTQCLLLPGIINISVPILTVLAKSKDLDWESFFNADTALQALEILASA